MHPNSRLQPFISGLDIDLLFQIRQLIIVAYIIVQGIKKVNLKSFYAQLRQSHISCLRATYIRDNVGWGRKWFVNFNAEKLILFRLTDLITYDVKMDGYVPEEKSPFKMLGLPFPSKLDWNSYIGFIAKTVSKKIRVLIRSMKILSPEVVFYQYKYTIRPSMEYCCHAWAGAPSYYLDMLDKIQKQICRTVGP